MPTYVIEGRDALTPVFADLNRYEVTTHFNGQSTVTIDGDRVTGESYTIAYHLFSEDGDRKIMVASLRYLDTFAKIDGGWYFAERKLLLDWSETRPSTPGPDRPARLVESAPTAVREERTCQHPLAHCSPHRN